MARADLEMEPVRAVEEGLERELDRVPGADTFLELAVEPETATPVLDSLLDRAPAQEPERAAELVVAELAALELGLAHLRARAFMPASLTTKKSIEFCAL